jgi:hypothetical protein
VLSSDLVRCEETPLVPPTLATILTVFTAILTVIATILTVVSAGAVVSADAVVSAGAVVSTCAVVVTTDGEIRTVVERSALSDRHEGTLMVPSGGDATHPVGTSSETVGDICTELTIGGSIVETLEECENTRVGSLRGVNGPDVFNDNVVVSNDLPLSVQLLRRGKVSVLSVDEDPGLHALGIQDNRERGVGVDVTTIGRERKLAGRHVVDTGYITHGRRVTRAPLNLLAICDGLADAEVDEIVVADKGVRFTSRLSFTINVLNDAGVQSEGITISPIAGGSVVVATTILVVVPAVLGAVSAILIVISTVLVVVPTALGAVSRVLVVVSAVLVVVPTILTVTTVTTEPVALTDNKSM